MPTRKLVQLKAYDSAWPQRYELEAPRVAAALGPPVEVEHIGSTAVPGLEAKPTIGYEPRGEMGVPGRRYFRKGPTYPREFNVHVVELGAYGALKRALVDSPDGAELNRYAEGKAAFIVEITRRATG